MTQIVLPLLGIAVWVVAAVRTLQTGRPSRVRWAWMAALPLVSVLCLLAWNFLVPKPHPASMVISRTDALLVGNAALGLAEWAVLLLLEPLLRWVARRLPASSRRT